MTQTMRNLRLVIFLLFAALFAASIHAQEKTQEKGTASSAGAQEKKQVPDAPSAARKDESTHRFWDKTNVLLFAGVGGARALDGISTVYMRNRGVEEWLLNNDVVDNHFALGVIEAAGTAASIGLSYLFHRTGHHKVERAISIVHIGVATGGAIRNFTLP